VRLSQHHVLSKTGLAASESHAIATSLSKQIPLSFEMILIGSLVCIRVLDIRAVLPEGHINAYATDEFPEFIKEHGITFEQAAAARQAASDAHASISAALESMNDPSLSKVRSVSVSILCEMPGIARSISENRERPPGSCAKERIKKILHLSPTLVRSSRTAAGVFMTAVIGSVG
jgi:hypothetical protein